MRISPILVVIVLVVVVILTGGAALGAYSVTRQFVSESPIQLPQLPDLSGQARPTTLPIIEPTLAPVTATVATGAVSVNATTAATTVPVVPTIANPTRITILLMGIDQRKGETGDFRTDTMMVLSLDPLRKTGVMLSIPRDIYLEIPDTNGIKNRINTAFDIGTKLNYPGGAPRLSVKTVQRLIGVKINYYILINFDAFSAIIDAVGPIKVCPETGIHDDKYPDGSYGYITVDFKAGCQELDSTHLLQYARVRHNAGDDFGRAQRQQEVIKAVRDKVLTLGGISSMIGQAGTLWDSLKTSVQTDMSFDQMLQLAQVAQTIPKENIRTGLLTDRDGYVLPATTPQNEQVFTPNYEKIHDLIEQLFDAPPGVVVAAPATQPITPPTLPATKADATQAAFVQPPGATSQPTTASTTPPTATPGEDRTAIIQVLNGSGVDGVGKMTVDKLVSLGFANVLPKAKNADVSTGLYAQSVIKVYNANKVPAARTLAAAMGLDGLVIKIEVSSTAGVDIDFIIGTDIAKKK